MDDLDPRVQGHAANARILAFLGGVGKRLRPFHGLGYDQGGVTLFDRYGRDLPEACKWSLGLANVLLHPATGVIFTVHYGRFTFLIRTADEPPRLRGTIETLDGSVDLSSLEPEWHDFYCEDDEDLAALHRAYERAAIL